MFSEDYSFYDLNREIQSMICNNKVNNLKMFVTSDSESKLSVTLRPNLRLDNQYHGLHPDFNESLLRDFLNELKNNRADSFWDMVNNFKCKEPALMNLLITDTDYTEPYITKIINNDEFRKELETSFLGKAFLQMASHFGFILKCDDIEQYESFKNTLLESFIEKGLYWECCDKSQEVKLLGIWPQDFINVITSKYDIVIDGLTLMVIEKHESEPNNSLYSLLSFENEWSCFFKLITSDIYYSGVMPCVKRIDYETNSSASGRVKYLVFNVVRTTYATLDAMDNSQILNHLFFTEKDCKKHHDLLIELDHYEDTLQEKYLYNNMVDQEGYDQKGNHSKMITDLNNYLKHSLNTHTIAVSTNLVTDDGYLLVGKRGSLNIDAGEYYCSANGQTEFLDEYVDFYRKSVFEDMPTMDYYSKYRVDLTNEVQRECIAELGVTSFDIDWNYYGVSYLSINNHISPTSNGEIESTKAINSRRMHFNVLMSNTLKQSFKEVVKAHKIATENFENEEIVGIKTVVFKTVSDFIKTMTLGSYYWLDENKSRMFLLLIFISIIIGKRNYLSLDISSYIDIGLIIIYLLISLVSWIKDMKIRKRMIKKYYYFPSCFDKKIFKMEKVFQKLSKKTKDAKLHAIFRVMYALYFLSVVKDD